MATEEEINDMNWAEVLETYQDQNLMHSFEGDSGMLKLNELCRDIGYLGHDYKYGSSLEHFLSDNPGACDAIINWMRKQHADDWRDNLVDMLEVSEEDEEDEEE